MNNQNMFDPAYLFPYAAIAARFKQDSGDGDANKDDFIQDIVKKWLPGSAIHLFYDESKLDFTYAIEHDGKLLIACLGTQGGLLDEGWKSDFSIQVETESFLQLGGHVDFIHAGEKTAEYFMQMVADTKYRYNFYIIGHSRGGPRAIAAARHFYRKLNAIPIRCITYCAPPVFHHSAADEYDKCGLGSVTIRVTMHHDPIDVAFIPVLKHVGIELKMPDIETTAEKHHGIIGKFFYGHAYSSVFECLQKYCHGRDMKKEWEWLENTKWIATV